MIGGFCPFLYALFKNKNKKLKKKTKKKRGKQYWIEDQLLAFGFTQDYRGS